MTPGKSDEVLMMSNSVLTFLKLSLADGTLYA